MTITLQLTYTGEKIKQVEKVYLKKQIVLKSEELRTIKNNGL